MRTVERCISGVRAAAATLVAIAFFGAMVLGGAASAGATEASAASLPIVPARGALFGAAVTARAGQDYYSAMTDLESDLGRKLDVQRLYTFWDDPQPNQIAVWDTASGRTPVLSIKAARRDGSAVRWADIAAGRQDAAIRAQAAGLQSLNGPIFLSLHHEPENDPGNGTPADYAAAWRHYVSVFRSMGVSNVAFTWILMAWSFVTPAVADSYYPGDDVVDYLGADGYNWYGTSPDKQWRSLADALGPFYAWGSAHHKPLMVAEWGTLEDPAVPGRKAAWLTDAAAALQTMPAIKVVCYFHAPVTFPWWVDSSQSSLQAFAAMGNDPYFRTVPEAALRVTPASGPAPLGTMISGAGSYTADEGGLSWRLDFGDGSAPLVSATPPGNVTHVYPAGSYTVRLSVSDLAGTRDVSTGTVTALPAPTVSTNRASDVAAGQATLNGHVDPNGLATTAWFQYGPTTGYGSATPATPAGADTRPVPVAAPVSLAPNTTYHYRALASNGAGTSVGADVPSPPTARRPRPPAAPAA